MSDYPSRPRFALWVKWRCVWMCHEWYTAWIWRWADNRVTCWHQERDAMQPIIPSNPQARAVVLGALARCEGESE